MESGSSKASESFKASSPSLRSNVLLFMAAFLVIFQFLGPSTRGASLIDFVAMDLNALESSANGSARDLQALEASADATKVDSGLKESNITFGNSIITSQATAKEKDIMESQQLSSNSENANSSVSLGKESGLKSGEESDDDNIGKRPVRKDVPPPLHTPPATGGTLRQQIHRNPNYNFTTAICTMLKDAEAYFEEWLDYHLLGLEFDHIYLYDNSDHFDLKHWYEHTHNHPVYSRVEVIHNSQRDQQLLMGKCIQKYGKNTKGPRHDYVAFIDLDEFLVIPNYPKSYTNIHGILQDYLVPFGGALTVNWMLVGTANRTVYAPLPVTKRFQYREAKVNPVIKLIAKSSDFFKLSNPHNVRLRLGASTHTTTKPGKKLKCDGPRCAMDIDRPDQVMLLYHFRYTSEKEYLYKKCQRGRPNSAESWCTEDGRLRKDTPEHIQMRPGEVFDDKPWQLLKEKAPKYKLYDQFEDLH